MHFRRIGLIMFRQLSFCFCLCALVNHPVCFGARLKSLERILENSKLTDDAPSQPTLLTPGSLSIRTWQWNVGKKDLEYEVDQLFSKRSDNVDIVATCITEGAPKKPMHDILKEKGLADKWALISYGKHKGIAGGVLTGNAQILSVFLRQPDEPYAVEASDIVKITGTGRGAAGWFQDTIMETAHVPGVLTAKTSLHQTSDSGKGGVSAKISFEGVDGFESKSIAVVCAHLDSEDSDDRRKGLVQILEEVASGAEVSTLDADFMDWPCGVFDSTERECQAKATKANLELDAVLLMGDLNFRIRWLKDDGTTDPFPRDLNAPAEDGKGMKGFFTADGRKKMALDDPLNPWSTSADILVKDAPRGLAFLCDEPYNWLPSYKRNKEDACISLAKKLRTCGQLGEFGPNSAEIEIQNCTSADEDEIADLAGSCFMDKKKNKWKLKKESKQEITERFLQMGWLDRLCFRSMGNSPMSFKIEEAYHWDDIPGGDHTAVELRLTISSAQGMCSLGMENGSDEAGVVSPAIVDTRTLAEAPPDLPSFKWLQAARTLMTQDEDGVTAQCPSGYKFSFVPKDADKNPIEGSGDKQDLTCKQTGLSTLDGVPASGLKCMRFCGPARMLEHGNREDLSYAQNPGAAKFVVGSKARYACEPFYELSGVAMHECNADGNYGEDIEGMRCLRTCVALSQLNEGMGKTGMVSLQRNPKNAISNPDAVVQGDAVSISCHGDSYVLQNSGGNLGGAEQATVQCLDTGKFDRALPKCLAKCGDPLSQKVLKKQKNLQIEIMGSQEDAKAWEASTQVLEGDVIKFTCKKGELQGLSAIRCGGDGSYVAHSSSETGAEGDPKCVAQCEAPGAIRYGKLSYKNGGLSNDGKLIAAGAEVNYGCNEGCVLLGMAKRTCQDDGVFDEAEPKCVCDATLVVKTMQYDGIERMDDVNHVKLKLFPLSLAKDVGSGHKGYDKDSYEKHKPAKMHDLDIRLNHELDQYFFHVELCESSASRWATMHGSRCHSLAISKAPTDKDDCPMCFGTILQQLFKLGDQPLNVNLPLIGEGVDSSGQSKAVLTMTLGSLA